MTTYFVSAMVVLMTTGVALLSLSTNDTSLGDVFAN